MAPRTPAGIIFVICAENGAEPQTVLDGFLDGRDANQFWVEVDANLTAGRVELVVAADVIPSELARIIEFLNDQMKCAVKAVELKYFEASDGRRTLVPRVLGETEKTKAQKSANRREKLPPIDVDEWIERYLVPLGQTVVDSTNINLEITKDLGGSIHVASSQGSLMSRFVSDDGKEIWPWSINQNGKIWIGFGWVKTRPAMIEESVRQNFLDRFTHAVGELTTDSITGFPAFPVERLRDSGIKDLTCSPEMTAFKG